MRQLAPALVLLAPLAAEAQYLQPNTISDVAEKVSPAVVQIATRAQAPRFDRRRHPQLPEGWEFFFGPGGPNPHGGGQAPQMGEASGVIISADGYIVTNNHVVRGASNIKVTMSDGRTLSAKLIGTDAPSDLALIKVEASGLPNLSFGDSGALRLGEFVLAVGNPFGVGQTVTLGIVSAKGRSRMGIVDYEDFIQTDAAINPGNSGGALVNLKGELVGINTAIVSRSGASAGIGFSVPASMVKPILDQIRTHGSVRRGFLGVLIQDLTPELAKSLDIKEERGAVISDVQEGGPAAKAGVEASDVVLALNGKPIASSSELRNRIAMLAPGTRAVLSVLRGSSKKEISVLLEQKKENGEEGSAQGEDEGPLAGVQLQDLTPELRRELEVPPRIPQGVVVSGVERDSPAGRAGLEEGDLIVSVNRRPVSSVAEVRRLTKAGTLLRVFSRGNFRFVVLND